MKMRHIPAHAIGVAALIAAPASAQQAATGQGTELEEVVVTGTAAGAEVRKLEASFAITTLDDTAITEYAPQSTADLLRLVPGVWSESTGGVSGANVMVRGFPGGGDAPYLTVQLNGAPVYAISTLSFLENTTMFRIDETVERVEALRGGPNPVFSNGQSGLTTNFILREGGEETEGVVKYTTSDYDLRRFDGYISGPISDDFYYMVGGYITSSPGLRDAGYNSDEGNQFTINLTRTPGTTSSAAGTGSRRSSRLIRAPASTTAAIRRRSTRRSSGLISTRAAGGRAA
jgi:iron complex outermembrane receptor protein